MLSLYHPIVLSCYRIIVLSCYRLVVLSSREARLCAPHAFPLRYTESGKARTHVVLIDVGLKTRRRKEATNLMSRFVGWVQRVGPPGKQWAAKTR